MKWWITLLAIGVTGFSFGQEPWHLWTQHHKHELDAFLTEHLDSLGYYTEMMYPDAYSNPDFRRCIHLMDLDQDGDMDAIYNGWSGAEGEFIEFWMAGPQGLIRSEVYWGQIREIYGAPNRFFMDVHQPGCCAEEWKHQALFCVTVTPDHVEVGTIKRTATAYAETEPFWVFGEPIPFEVTQATYHLRLGPEINTTDWFMDHPEPGNSIGVYTTGAKGTAVSHATDDTGRVWWYVIMEPTSETNPTYVTGWMSSRFLRVITND